MLASSPPREATADRRTRYQLRVTPVARPPVSLWGGLVVGLGPIRLTDGYPIGHFTQKVTATVGRQRRVLSGVLDVSMTEVLL